MLGILLLYLVLNRKGIILDIAKYANNFCKKVFDKFKPG